MCLGREVRAKPQICTVRTEPRCTGLASPGGTLILSPTEVPTQVVAFVASVLVAVLLVAIMFPMAKRRPVGTPLSWGEAMVASVWAFFLMFWVYGMVPHLWLTWTSNELGWRPDKILTGPAGILKNQKAGGFNPLTLNYQVLRDIGAVALYGIFLGLNMYLIAWWQNRGKRAESVPAVVTSDYGRPLVKKS